MMIKISRCFIFTGLYFAIIFFDLAARADLKPQDINFRECRPNGRCIQISSTETKINPSGTVLQFPKSLLKIYQTPTDKNPKRFDCDNIVYWQNIKSVYCDQWTDQKKSTLYFDGLLNLKTETLSN